VTKRKKYRLFRASNGRWKWIAFFILSLCLALAIYYGYRILGPNTTPFSDHKYFYIHSGSTYRDVVRALEQQGIIKHTGSFEWLARKLDYPAHVYAGKYDIRAGMSNLAIIRLLRSGRQTPVRLVINKLRTKADFASLISKKLEPDSATMMALLNDEVYLRQFGLDTNTALCAVIPNTYQFFWNTSAEDAFKRLKKERDRFWNTNRKARADSLGLSRNQIYILSSIVEEETNKNSDKPLIASVYLNRLRSGMPLAADPTARFAMGDFSLRRITGAQTAFESLYNTYRHAGLPPGPICTPSIKTIDAVLRAPKTNYYYFCARPDFSGYNVYASTYNEHLKNARAYQKALDSLNIH
jgi:UPF0755 protein